MTLKRRVELLVDASRLRLTRALTDTDPKQEYRQVENLLALHALLQPTSPLPPTRGWAACPDALRVLVEHVLEDAPQVIVEFGSGTSTVILATAAQRAGTGHVHSFDHKDEFVEQTRQTLAARGLRDWATVTHAPLVPLTDPGLSATGLPSRWYAIEALPDDIDLVFIDGPPRKSGDMARYPSLPAVAGRVSGGATIILDDAHRREERTLLALWQQRFPKADFSVLPTERGTGVIRWPTDDR